MGGGQHWSELSQRRIARVTAAATVLMAAGTVIGLWGSGTFSGDGSQRYGRVAGVSKAINNGANIGGNICSGVATCIISPDQSSSTTSTTLAPPAPLNLAMSCPNPDVSVPSAPKITICVIYWCHAPAYDTSGNVIPTEYQIKLRPLITSFSTSPVNVGISRPSALRLLVYGNAIASNWQPRAGTLDYGDRPFTVHYEGNSFWAIAPNRPSTEVLVPSIGQYTGFATTWNYGSVLEPHQDVGSVQQDRDDEDLVFEVPLPSVAANQPISQVLGLALINYTPAGAQVEALAPTSQWLRQQQPSTF